MKKQIFIAAFGLFGVFGYSQANTPWPASGSVGIGTTTPATKLDVVRNFILSPSLQERPIASFVSNDATFANKIKLNVNNYTSGGTMFSRLQSTYNTTNRGFIQFGKSSSLATPLAISFGYDSTTHMRILEGGKVAIGDVTTPGDYDLYVEEGILTEKVKVAIKTTTDWADYVFAPDYKLMPLQDVAVFTTQNGHLPNVPSAKDMVAEGLDVAKMDAKLLEKIEELTLYAIDQDKQIDSLEAKLAKQEHEMAEMKAQMKAIMTQKQ